MEYDSERECIWIKTVPVGGKVQGEENRNDDPEFQDESKAMSLDDLPFDVLQHLFSFLDSYRLK